MKSWLAWGCVLACAVGCSADDNDPSRLGEATDTAAKAIAERFGPGAVDGKIQAHIVTIEN